MQRRDPNQDDSQFYWSQEFYPPSPFYPPPHHTKGIKFVPDENPAGICVVSSVGSYVGGWGMGRVQIGMGYNFQTWGWSGCVGVGS